MTKELERIGKVLVGAEGGCWHDLFPYAMHPHGNTNCTKCKELFPAIKFFDQNPDFSKWENFGRLLKIGQGINIYALNKVDNLISLHFRVGESSTIDNLPLTVATELARIIEEKA